jgi:hypothetical protein
MSFCCPKKRGGVVLGGSGLAYLTGDIYSNYVLMIPLDSAMLDHGPGEHHPSKSDPAHVYDDDGVFCNVCQRFDGLGWVDIFYLGRNAFSFSILAKPDGTLLSNGTFFTQGNISVGHTFNRKVRVVYSAVQSDASIVQIELWGSGSALTLGDWSYIAGNYDGHFLNVWANGEHVINKAIGVIDTPDYIHLGQRTDGTERLVGCLQEFRYAGGVLPSTFFEAEWMNYSNCGFVG